MPGQAPICSCITCSDQAVEVVVLALDPASGLARCAVPGGGEEDVDVALVDPVAVGSRLMVHAGAAIALAPELVA